MMENLLNDKNLAENSKTAYKRTTKDQLECFLDFAVHNPELLANKNDPKNPRRIEQLWVQLAGNLNSLRGATRTSDEWRKTLSHWKNAVKSRARKEKIGKIKTGGGPAVEEKVDNLEERALSIFGKICVHGDEEIIALGLEDMVDSTDSTNSFETINDEAISQNLELNVIKKRPLKRKSEFDSVYQDVMNTIKEKNESDKVFQDQFLASQMKLAEALKSVGDGMRLIAQNIRQK